MNASDLLVLGSTGSIGTQTLELVRANPQKLRVTGLSANSNISLLRSQIEEFQPQYVAISDEASARLLRQDFAGKLKVFGGEEALVQIVSECRAEIVIVAVLGFAALTPVAEALKQGRKLALANKECLVVGGDLIRPLIKQHGGEVVPVDSEHSSIFQLLRHREMREVAKITLTASGGPFLRRALDSFSQITPEEAVKHPRWNMGAKISVDSATLMNKGLEVIEAAQLFDLPADKIDVLIHPESLIHGLVEERSGALLACAFSSDMKLPIAYAIEQLAEADLVINNGVKPLDLATWGKLHFEAPENDRFPALQLAYHALRGGGSLPAVLNGANEVAVSKFLARKLSFTAIIPVVEQVLERHSKVVPGTLEELHQIDAESRLMAEEVIARLTT